MIDEADAVCTGTKGGMHGSEFTCQCAFVSLQEYMSCFGGLSPVLSSIGAVLRLHCGRIVCAPNGSGQESYDQYALGPGLDPNGADGDQDGPIEGSEGILNGEHAHLNGNGISDTRQLRSLVRRSGV